MHAYQDQVPWRAQKDLRILDPYAQIDSFLYARSGFLCPNERVNCLFHFPDLYIQGQCDHTNNLIRESVRQSISGF